MNLDKLNKGKWGVSACGKIKPCKNLETAEAWAKYIIRRFKRTHGWTDAETLRNLNMILIHGDCMTTGTEEWTRENQ